MVRRWMIVSVMLGAMPVADALGASRIPSSAMPGRERQQLFDQPFPQVPRIELQDGRPREVIQTPRKSRPAKRNRNRGSRR
jgi:hypothetical protein